MVNKLARTLTSGCSSVRWKEASKHNCISTDSPFHLPKSSLPQSPRLKPASQNPLSVPINDPSFPTSSLCETSASPVTSSSISYLKIYLTLPDLPPPPTSFSSVASTAGWNPYSSFRVHLQKEKPLRLVWAGLRFRWLTYCWKIWRRHLKQSFQEQYPIFRILLSQSKIKSDSCHYRISRIRKQVTLAPCCLCVIHGSKTDPCPEV